MKEKVLEWVDSCNKKEMFYWLHFIFYCLSNLKVEFVNYIRAFILIMYLSAFIYLIIKKHTYKLPPKYFLITFGLYIVLNTLIIRTFSVHILYCVITFIIIKELKFTRKQVLYLINKTAIIYLLVSLVLNYTPLNFLSLYNNRQVSNKFLPLLLYRLLGIEGTPAGADIFYSIVLISNIVLNKTKNKRFYITLSAIILVWTSSFAPILSIAGALLILPFTNNKLAKAGFGSMIWLYQFIIIFIYSFGFVKLNNLLNLFSTLRARIWFRMYWSLIENNTLATWNLGRKALVDFVNKTTTNNPHNYSLFLLEFAGIPMFIIIIAIVTIYYMNMKDKYMIFIVTILFIYASTNTFIFSIRGNPIFIYILVTYISFEREPKIE